MYRIIGGDGREYGPVTGDTIRQWIVQNRANSKTLVRAENTADWRPLGEIPEFGGSFGAPPPQPAAGEPPPPPPPASPRPAAEPDAEAKALTATLPERECDIDIGECISAALRLLGRNYWPSVGVVFLVLLCSSLISAVPVIGVIASLLLTHVFYAGLYFHFIKQSRGEPTSVADGFSGFSRSFGHLVLLSLVMQILLMIVVLPALIPTLGIYLWKWNPFLMVPLAVALAIPLIYLAIAWIFAPLLVIDRGLEFWDAMELSRKVVSRHWFKVFFLTIVAGILGISGVIVLVVGLVFTMPIMFAAMAIAYEWLFPGDR